MIAVTLLVSPGDPKLFWIHPKDVPIRLVDELIEKGCFDQQQNKTTHGGDMKPLTVAQLQSFETFFKDEKRRILSSHSKMEFGIDPNEIRDEVDMMSAELESSLQMRLASRESLYLKKLDEAMQRIRSGCFGTCSHCEENLSFERLQARPTATACVSCKEGLEKSEKTFAQNLRPKSLGVQLKFA